MTSAEYGEQAILHGSPDPTEKDTDATAGSVIANILCWVERQGGESDTALRIATGIREGK